MSKPIPMKEALPLLGGITPQTFVRWATEGVEGRRLDAFKIGKCWFTTSEAIEQFKARPDAPSVRIPRIHSDASERLREEFGI